MMLRFSKYVLMKKQIHLHFGKPEDEYCFSIFSFKIFQHFIYYQITHYSYNLSTHKNKCMSLKNDKIIKTMI